MASSARIEQWIFTGGSASSFAMWVFLISSASSSVLPLTHSVTSELDAIAEPQRRDILALLRAGEWPVTDLAQQLGLSQPGASKHLRVLREVGLVRVRGAGKQRLYGLDARGLRPVHEWVGGFERFWNESFDRLDAYVQDLKQARQEE